MGNLITHEDSFRWTDPTINYGEQIQILNEVLNEARNLKDETFKTPAFQNLTLPWGNFIDFFFNNGFDDIARTQTFPWMGQIQFQTLLGILYPLKFTPNGATNLTTLEQEYPNSNNSLFGLSYGGEPETYVKCKPSFNEFHRKYVSNFSFQQQKENFKYFKKFYVPQIKNTSVNQFNNRINQRLEHRTFLRIDPIVNPIHDKIHIHFTTQNAALSIDGTWRHDPPENFRIEDAAQERLAEIGFILPDEYYN